MPCCIGLFALSAPRVAIVLVVIFSDYIGRAYDSVWVPFLGFLFLPLTTLAYAWSINSTGEVKGLHLAAVILAALIDLGVIGGNSKRKKKKDAG